MIGRDSISNIVLKQWVIRITFSSNSSTHIYLSPKRCTLSQCRVESRYVSGRIGTESVLHCSCLCSGFTSKPNTRSVIGGSVLLHTRAKVGSEYLILCSMIRKEFTGAH